MTASWSTWPLARTVALAGLGRLGPSLSSPTVHSKGVHPLLDHPGWLYKAFRVARPPAEDQALRRLVELPGGMSSADTAVVATRTAWPSARVLDGSVGVGGASGAVGVVVPRAPSSCDADVRGTKVVHRTTTVDLLALPADEQQERALPGYSARDRLEVCATITAVAALLWRHDLVYLDWSYTNVLWSVGERFGYVIDLDGCSFGPRRQVEAPMFEDPLVPKGAPAGTEVDSFRVALLAARCLTAQRGDADDAVAGLARLGAEDRTYDMAGDVLARALLAPEVELRPSVALIDLAVTSVRNELDGRGHGDGRGRVRGWRPVSPPSARGSPSPSLLLPRDRVVAADPVGGHRTWADAAFTATTWPVAVGLIIAIVVVTVVAVVTALL